LLTATPHRGRTDTFKKLLQLLDPDIFATNEIASIRIKEIEYNGINKFFIRRLKEDMKDLHEKMKDIHIEIFSDKDGGDSSGFAFNFEMPEMPEMPDLPDLYLFDDDCKGKIHDHSFSGPEMEGLDDDDHVMIMGDEHEQAPVFEKEITGRNGEKIFIYKRSKPINDKPEQSSVANDPVKLFPNPNDGRFSMKFSSDKKDDLIIHIYDSQGKEVYAETIKDFTGNYFNRVDISDRKKGNYFLKITQGGDTYTEKFVIE
jgi:hypothetical protein